MAYTFAKPEEITSQPALLQTYPPEPRA